MLDFLFFGNSLRYFGFTNWVLCVCVFFFSLHKSDFVLEMQNLCALCQIVNIIGLNSNL